MFVSFIKAWVYLRFAPGHMISSRTAYCYQN